MGDVCAVVILLGPLSMTAPSYHTPSLTPAIYKTVRDLGGNGFRADVTPGVFAGLSATLYVFKSSVHRKSLPWPDSPAC